MSDPAKKEKETIDEMLINVKKEGDELFKNIYRRLPGTEYENHLEVEAGLKALLDKASVALLQINRDPVWYMPDPNTTPSAVGNA